MTIRCESIADIGRYYAKMMRAQEGIALKTRTNPRRLCREEGGIARGEAGIDNQYAIMQKRQIVHPPWRQRR
jgi:hypothetical protein